MRFNPSSLSLLPRGVVPHVVCLQCCSNEEVCGKSLPDLPSCPGMMGCHITGAGKANPALCGRNIALNSHFSEESMKLFLAGKAGPGEGVEDKRSCLGWFLALGEWINLQWRMLSASAAFNSPFCALSATKHP